ncbi:MAG: divalent-cation tolerance protein CutA [Cyanobacteriota bacterium]|jgi:periplasmic divalent cation tolerance protein
MVETRELRVAHQPLQAHQTMEAHQPDPGKEDRSDLVLVLTTEASLETAERLARALLERRLVACVSLVPIVSHYRWQGQLTRGEEVQLLLKTRETSLRALHESVLTLHSYETPEWITLTAHSCGSYGLWCAEQLLAPGLRADGGPPAPPGSLGDGDPTE